jgi:hypothetical protein
LLPVLPVLLLLLLLLLSDIGLGDQRVEFPADVDPTSLHGKVRSSSMQAAAHSMHISATALSTQKGHHSSWMIAN